MIPFSKTERESTAFKEMRQLCRNTFGTAEGRRVLGYLLTRFCNFGVPLETDVDRIEYNTGLAIAEMSGIMADIDRIVGIKEE